MGVGRAAAIAAISLILDACGGGGSVSPGPTQSLPPHPSNSGAAGTLVDDPSGTPLAGVTVRLDPWQWGSGPVSGSAPLYTPPPNIVPGPSPTPILTTVTDSQGRFTINAPNGTYLLVIGSDDPNDTTRPTIHDRLELSGQTVLAAPSMPPIPGITPAPVETNGDYRLVSIDQTHELPCIADFDAQRTQRNLPKPVIDEWLTENVRASVDQSVTPFNKQTDPRNPYGFLTSGNALETAGTDCSFISEAAFENNAINYATASPWFAGSYLPYQAGAAYSAFGAAEFPIDPRRFGDFSTPIWP